MNDIASSAAPPTALKLWTDGKDIYIEIPGRQGPYITSHLYDHRAIDYVFSLLGATRIDYEHAGTLPDPYRIRNEPGTETQRALAERTLAGFVKHAEKRK